MLHNSLHEQEMSLAVICIQRTRVGVSAPVFWRQGWWSGLGGWRIWNTRVVRGTRGVPGVRACCGLWVCQEPPVVVLWVSPKC